MIYLCLLSIQRGHWIYLTNFSPVSSAHKKFTFLKVNLCSFKLNSVKLNAVMGTSRVFSQLEQNNHLTLIQSPERKLATTMG